MNINTLAKSVFTALAAVPMLFFTSSCIEEDDVTFSTNFEGYILQQNDAAGRRTFTPYFFVNSSSSSYMLDTVVMYNSNMSLPMVKYSNYSFRTNMESTPLSSPEELNGTFTVISTATNRLAYTSTLTLNFDEADTLGTIEITDFEYNGSYVRATVKEVAGAATLGLIITPYDNGNTPNRFNNIYISMLTNPTYTNGEITLSYYFVAASSLGNDKARVRVYATNGGGIYRESDLYKTITRGNSAFDEDN